mmetsp:Transcript_6/g.11  ORF Transcript_6/g.11 Transcript_6/m.11 type:complete len:436 (-) Transcript_6:311-1618(-)
MIMDVLQLVPDATGRRITIIQERHTAGLRMVGLQLHILLNSIDHCSTTGMDAEVIDSTLEIRYINLGVVGFGYHFRNLTRHDTVDNLGLLGEREDVRTQTSQILLHALSSNLHNLLAEHDTTLTILILGLIHAFVRLLIRSLHTDIVQKLVPRTATVGPFVGEHHGSSSTAEQGVLKQETTLISMVQIGRDNLSGHNKRGTSTTKGQTRVFVFARLQQLLREFDGDQGCRAAHTTQIVCLTVFAHAELVQDHGAERWRGAEETAVDHEEINILGMYTCFLQSLLHNIENNSLGLLTRCFNRTIGRYTTETLHNTRRPRGGLTGTRLVQNLTHKRYRFFCKDILCLHNVNEIFMRHLPALGGLKGAKGHQVNGVFHASDPSNDNENDNGSFNGRIKNGEFTEGLNCGDYFINGWDGEAALDGIEFEGDELGNKLCN